MLCLLAAVLLELYILFCILNRLSWLHCQTSCHLSFAAFLVSLSIFSWFLLHRTASSWSSPFYLLTLKAILQITMWNLFLESCFQDSNLLHYSHSLKNKNRSSTLFVVCHFRDDLSVASLICRQMLTESQQSSINFWIVLLTFSTFVIFDS